MKLQRGTIQESDPDTNQTMNVIKETEVYCTYTQSRWFYCFSMRAPPSHLAHLPPLFSELLTDNVIRGKEFRVRFSVAETEVTRVPASCLECTMNTLLDPSLPDGVSKTLYLRTGKSCEGNTLKLIFNSEGSNTVLLRIFRGPGSSVGMATDYGLDGPGSNPCWDEIFRGTEAHPASCKMGTGSFLRVKCDRIVLLTTHPLLVPRSLKCRAIPLPTLWATTGL